MLREKTMKTATKLIIRILILWAIFCTALFLFYWLREKYYDYRLNLFDLNRDGFFSPAEQTSEWEYWEGKVIGDGGLAVLPFFIPVLLIFSSVLNLASFYINKMIKRKKSD